jgi:hypothetical protein
MDLPRQKTPLEAVSLTVDAILKNILHPVKLSRLSQSGGFFWGLKVPEAD